MSTPHIVFLDAATVGSDIHLSPLDDLGALDKFPYTSPSECHERIKDAEIIITNKVVLGEEHFAAARKLRLIALTATGFNNIDVDAARARGIAVTNVAGYSTESVAQHAFALLLSLLNETRYHDDYVKSGDYSHSGRFTHLERPFWELQDKTFGIIGLGAIGRATGRIAEAFGCRIRFFSSSGKSEHERWQRVDLETLLAESDVISIHAPLNERTRALIGAKEIAAMRSHAILLNLARGGIVDEQALAEAIDSGTIGGAAFDVFSSEPPPPNSPLLQVRRPDRLLLTPHTGWSSREARTRLIDELAENIRAFNRGERRNRID